jgi:hypothetical protein
LLTEALQKVTTLLDELRIPYALIGGLAVIARGVVRATRDVDLLIDAPLGDGRSLAISLNHHGLPGAFQKGDLDDPIPGLIRLDVPVSSGAVRCDLLFPARTWEAEAVRNAAPVDVEGFVIRVATAADLFLLKLRAGGPQDLLDAAELLRIQPSEEQAAWKTTASKRRLSREFKRCQRFLKETD